MNKKSLILLLLLPSLAWADRDNHIGYDDIVSELNQTKRVRKKGSAFDAIEFHLSVAYISSYLTLTPRSSKALTGFMGGYEASLGIDLFDPDWVSEMAIRTFQKSELNEQTKVSLREFDLRLVYRPKLSSNSRMRLGLGLTGRYLSLVHPEILEEEFTTPSSILFLGSQVQLLNSLSLGMDLSYRSAMIEDTIDKSAFEGAVRAELHF